MLKQIKELADQLKQQEMPDPRVDNDLKKALYDNLDENVELALNVYDAVERNAMPGFRTDPVRKRVVERAIKSALVSTDYDVEAILGIVVAQTNLF